MLASEGIRSTSIMENLCCHHPKKGATSLCPLLSSLLSQQTPFFPGTWSNIARECQSFKEPSCFVGCKDIHRKGGLLDPGLLTLSFTGPASTRPSHSEKLPLCLILSFLRAHLEP